MTRLILGVIVGYVVFVVTAVLVFGLTGRDPHAPSDTAFMVGAIGAGVIAAMAGGYIGAAFAKGSEHAAGLMIAVVIASAAVISLVTAPDAGARWSQIATLAVMSPSAYVGALIRWRRRHPA